MKLNDLISQLELIDRTQTDTYAQDFDAVLAEIVDLQDPEAIGLLIPFFRNDAPFDELMFSIIHSIESFPDSVYVHELLKATPRFWQTSLEWIVVVYLRIVNSEAARLELVRQLRDSEHDIKNVVRDVMERINHRDTERFTRMTEPVLDAIS